LEMLQPRPHACDQGRAPRTRCAAVSGPREPRRRSPRFDAGTQGRS
jgi:hypothetical protein